MPLAAPTISATLPSSRPVIRILPSSCPSPLPRRCLIDYYCGARPGLSADAAGRRPASGR
jgi:hypothetical protein